MEQHERLRQYNRWRRGQEDWTDDERGPDPKELGELIDGVADRLEVLEREHQEFFDRWHEERRKREAMDVAMRDVFPVAHRLALELECLLLDTKDTAAVSKWWDSAHEALEQWREFCREDSTHNGGGNGRAACRPSALKRQLGAGGLRMSMAQRYAGYLEREANTAATPVKAEAMRQAANKLRELERENNALRADAARLDWLADPSNEIGNVQLPTHCVTANLGSLRDAIDMAMREQEHDDT